MSNLLSLKRDAQETNRKLVARRQKRLANRMLIPPLGFPPFVAGAMLLDYSSRFGSIYQAWAGVLLIVATVAAGFFAARWKGGKKETALKKANSIAVNAYMSALWTEAASLGIDITSTITQRTEPLSNAYEITAMRNGSPVDVVVREYDGEVVFMLNGELMQQVAAEFPVTATRKWFGR